MKSFLITFSCMLFTQSLFANNALASKYYSIQSLEHFAVPDNGQPPILLSTTRSFKSQTSPYIRRPITTDISVEDIINIGEWLWTIVKENKPTVNFKKKEATAIPKDAVSPMNMENWESPTSLSYIMVFKNGFGSEVVRFKYKLIFSPKGSYNGTGKYLANTSIHPTEIDVSWGFDFNAEVEIEDILNMSSKKDPTAGIQIALKWNVDSWTDTIEGQSIYFVQGDGQHKEL